MFRAIKILFRLGVFALFFSGICLRSSAQDKESIARNYYQYNLNRIIDHIVPDRSNMRAKLFMDMDTLPFLIMNQGKAVTIKVETFAFDDEKRTIEFYDLDKDGRADEFHVLTKEGKPSPDFGFLYDLNRDSIVDYILFWGGFMISHDAQIFKWNHHWIDSDYDGRIDVITNNVLIMPGDKNPDPHYLLWVMDNNRDGKPEVAEIIHLTDGKATPLNQEGDKWHYKDFFDSQEIDPKNEKFFSFYNTLLEKVKRF
jgi:hypothetical protein